MRPNQSWLPDLRMIDFPPESLVTVSERRKKKKTLGKSSSFNRPLLFPCLTVGNLTRDIIFGDAGLIQLKVGRLKAAICLLKMSEMIQIYCVEIQGKEIKKTRSIPWSQYWEPGVIWSYKVLIRSYKAKNEVHYCTNSISHLEWRWAWLESNMTTQ